MRNIKFRGKSVENSKWVYGFFIEDMGKSYILAKENESDYRLSWFEVENQTVGQSTGIFDKNKKEIFEGDVLRHELQGDMIVYYPFSGKVASYGLQEIKRGALNTLQDTEDLYEVISNIYDGYNKAVIL